MRVTRRTILRGAPSVLAAPALLRTASAQGTITLRMHHFVTPISNPHQRVLVPWTERVAKDSGGRLKIEIFPAMQLGGTPPQLFDQARDGVVDIAWTLPGNTPGRFPKIEVFELPFVANRKALVNSKSLWQFAETHLLMDEFREVKVLGLWAHDHGLIHANRQVRTMEDLKGLKLRFPTRQAGEALKALGASAIGMPLPQVPESLAQRVIDGCVVPWEIVPAIKVHELLKFHTDIPGSPTLYTSTFVLAMNKAKYDALPADLKAILDRNSGATLAEIAGRQWDEMGLPVADMVAKRGNTITVLSEAEKKRWQQATQPVIEAWLKGAKDKGIDGGKLLEDAKALLQKYAAA
jgi:TRAP-type C4-dicarboxylate transport system substrate-binding protein